MRETCADILDPEPADEQLRQLEHARRELGAQLAHGAHARRRRRDDSLEPVEDPREAGAERERLVAVAAVQVQLPAAGLLAREDDLVAEPLQHGDRRLRRLRKQRVTETGDEEADAHAPDHRIRVV